MLCRGVRGRVGKTVWQRPQLAPPGSPQRPPPPAHVCEGPRHTPERVSAWLPRVDWRKEVSPSAGTHRGLPTRGPQGEAGPPPWPTQMTGARSPRDAHVGRHPGRDTPRHPGARAEDSAPGRHDPHSRGWSGQLGRRFFLSLGHYYSVFCQTIKEINRTLVLNAIQLKLRFNKTRDCLGDGRRRRQNSRGDAGYLAH